jgi:hypothetical protein
MLTWIFGFLLKKCSPTLLLPFVLCLTALSVGAQYDDRLAISLPSPNNIFATSYLNTNVNMYTGGQDITLPLYTLKTKELSIPLSLVYKATGVRLQDVASYVGTGWNLQGAGVLSRIVRGLPDESEKGYIGKNQAGKEMNTGGDNVKERSEKIARGDLDGEPDLFFVSTPTGECSFIFDENGAAVFNQPCGYKISFERASANDDLSITWYVTDESGTRYTYGADVGAREYVKQQGQTTPEVISSWYLSRVTSFDKSTIINLSYVQGPDVSMTTYNKTRVKFTSNAGCNKPPDFVSGNDVTRTYIKPKYLSAINSATGKILFRYMSNRPDLEGGFQLLGIDVYNTTDILPIKKYILNFGLLHPMEENKENNRTFLKNIYTLSGDGKSSLRLYNFNYYMDPALKFPSRKSVAYDHLGFYNNNSESTPFVPEADKSFDLNKTLQYTLQSIEHAQGGKTEFAYELNTYYDKGTNTDKTFGGLRIKSIKEYDNTGKSYTRIYEYKLENGFSSGQIASNNRIYLKSAGIIGAGTGGMFCFIGAESTNAGLLFSLSDLNGVSTGYSRVKMTAPDGGYEVSNFTNFSDYPDKFSIYNFYLGSVVDPNSIRQFGYPTSYSYKRGLIKSKSAFNSDGKPVSDVIYSYDNLRAPQNKSRGVSLTVSTTGLVTNYFEDVYYYVMDCYKLVKEEERTYDQKNSLLFTSRIKDYAYNSQYTLLKTITSNSSEGQTSYDKWYFAEDKQEITGLTADEAEALTLMNGLNTPIREEHYTDAAAKTIRQSNFTAMANGAADKRVYLKKVLSGRNNILDTDMEYIFDFNTGNVITSVARNGTVSGFLWSNDNVIIAKAEGATGGEIYYQSFEEVATAVTGKGFSGRKYFNGSFTIPFKRPNTKKYLLSYRKLINNEWTLITTTYATDNLLLNESVPVDDIRVYPEDALMTTYTHIPLAGITSVCDANYNIQYFEYDNLYRLKDVRDLNGNIVKQVYYKYANDLPMPLPRALISNRDEYIEEDSDAHYVKTANVYVIMVDETGKPVYLPEIKIRFKQSHNSSEGGSSTTDREVTITGHEALIYSGTIIEYYFDANGKPTNTTTESFRILPGEGYSF